MDLQRLAADSDLGKLRVSKAMRVAVVVSNN